MTSATTEKLADLKSIENWAKNKIYILLQSAPISKLENTNVARFRGWKFKWDNATVRFGCCNYRTKTISLSRKLTERNSEEQAKDTVLHEIAHVLAGSNAKHGPVWKEWAVKVGARPEQYYRADEVKPVDAKWVVKDNFTGEVFAEYVRRPKSRDWSKAWIRGRKNETLGRMVLEKV